MPGLKSKSAAVSPFTLVFQQAGSRGAASFMNAVVMTSALSAGNHALFAGTRVLHGMATKGLQAPKFLGTVAKSSRVPWVALACTASISGLCFGSSYIGAGDLWNWLQNLVAFPTSSHGPPSVSRPSDSAKRSSSRASKARSSTKTGRSPGVRTS